MSLSQWQQYVPPEAVGAASRKGRIVVEKRFVRGLGNRISAPRRLARASHYRRGFGRCRTQCESLGETLGEATDETLGETLGETCDCGGVTRNRGEDTRTILMWALDISERKRAEDELRASENQMRAIVENLHDGLILTDLNDTIFYANGRISELTGYENNELIGRNAHRFLTSASEWDECEIRNRARLQGQSDTYEIPLRHKNGSVRWMLINGSPLRDAGGAIIGTIGAHFDITERKRDETARAQFAVQLENSNRDLEIFAFAVSHDPKMPLRKIEVFGGRLEQSDGADLSPEGRLYLDRMRDASRRMSALIDGLLAYSRAATGPQARSDVDLNGVAREVLLDLELAIERSGATIEVAPLPTVRADATQMRQLLQNLVGNALAYRRPGMSRPSCA